MKEIRYPVSVGQEPEGEPDAETMTVLRDANGRDLDVEEVAAALNAFAPSHALQNAAPQEKYEVGFGVGSNLQPSLESDARGESPAVAAFAQPTEGDMRDAFIKLGYWPNEVLWKVWKQACEWRAGFALSTTRQMGWAIVQPNGTFSLWHDKPKDLGPRGKLVPIYAAPVEAIQSAMVPMPEQPTGAMLALIAGEDCERSFRTRQEALTVYYAIRGLCRTDGGKQTNGA